MAAAGITRVWVHWPDVLRDLNLLLEVRRCLVWLDGQAEGEFDRVCLVDD